MKRYFLVAVVVMFLFLSLGLSFASLNNGRPDNYPELGLGCTNVMYIDNDCDGYGVGDGYVLGPDADDTDSAVNTAASVIVKYGSIANFLSTRKGYTCDRYTIVDPQNGISGGAKKTTWISAIASPVHDVNDIPYATLAGGDCVLFRGTPGITTPHTTRMDWASNNGVQGKPIILIAYPGELPHYVSDSVFLALRPGAHDWTVDGFHFSGSTNMSNSLMISGDHGPSRIVVRNNEFRWGTSAIRYMVGPQLDNIIEYNNMHDLGAGGGGDYDMYLGNRCIGSSRATCISPEVSGLIIRGNVFRRRYSTSGIFQFNGYGHNFLAEKNIFSGANGYGSFHFEMGLSNTTIQNNVFLGGDAANIRMAWYAGGDMGSNEYIRRYDMSNNKIINNDFVAFDRPFDFTYSWGSFFLIIDDSLGSADGQSCNAAPGIPWGEAKDCEAVVATGNIIRNNIIYLYGQGVNADVIDARANGFDTGPASKFTNCSSNTPAMDHNVIYRYGGAAANIHDTISDYLYRLNNSSGYFELKGVPQCPALWNNNQFANPLYTAISQTYYNQPEKVNLAVPLNSPAKGNGDVNYMPVDDIKGTLRTGYDAGAYLIAAAPLVNFTVTKVRDSGNSSACIDLCFVGSGYNSSQQASFDSRFNTYHSNLFATNWFHNNSDKFNVWKFNVVSPYSGVALAFSDVQDIVGNMSCDWVIILHNFADGGYGYSQYYSIGQAPLNFMEFYTIDQPYLLAHELAHSFSYAAQSPAGVYIGDEYYDNPQQPACTGMSKYVFNSHDKDSNEKWGDLISTPPFEGSNYCPTGLWRPTFVSVMSDGSQLQDFNAVVYKALDKSVGKILGTIEKTAPTLSVTGISRDGTYSGTVTVGATVSDASGIERVEFYFGPYNGINWTGLYAQHSVKIDRTAPYSWDMNTSHYPDGRYAVDVFVYDNNWNVARYMTWFNASNGVHFNPADTNQDGCIEFSELMSYVSRWQVSSKDVSLGEIIAALKLWKGGCS